MKERVKTGKNGFFSNIAYVFGEVRRVDRPLFWCNIFSVLMQLIIPVLDMVITPCIIYILSDSRFGLRELILTIGGLIFVKTLAGIISTRIEARKYVAEHKLVLHYHEKIYSKIMKVDYDMIENPQTKVIYDKAEEAVMNNHTPFVHMPENFCRLITGILKFAVFCFIIVVFNPLVLIALALTAGLEYLTMLYIDNYEYKTRDERIRISRKMKYFAGLSENYKTGKDIRLYGLNTWLKKSLSLLMKEHHKLFSKLALRKIASSAADLLVIVARDGFAYVYLISKVAANEITPAEFVLYFSVISGFVDILGEIVMSFEQLTKGNYSAKDFRAFMGTENRICGELAMKGDEAESVVFDNVSFRYPGAEGDTISNVSFEIHSGEKVAIVGLNGAGKTTLIKLLCGMYHPTGGSIKLNGNEQTEYARDEYYNGFSSVFQRISVMPFTIRENVVYSEFSRDKLDRCLEISGLNKKVKGLSDGIETYLVPNVFSKAVDLSGGEMQKLALARAMYKNGPVLVLDEPTAALDPLAEEEMYQSYSRYSNNKISFFISHRLASTRFCDKIFYLENGKVVESGTHSELLSKRGKYAELFDIQAKYYKEAAVNM